MKMKIDENENMKKFLIEYILLSQKYKIIIYPSSECSVELYDYTKDPGNGEGKILEEFINEYYMEIVNQTEWDASGKDRTLDIKKWIYETLYPGGEIC